MACYEKLSSFTRCSRRGFLCAYSALDDGRDGVRVLRALRCLWRELFTYPTWKVFFCRVFTHFAERSLAEAFFMLISFFFSYSDGFFFVFYLSFCFVLGQDPSARRLFIFIHPLLVRCPGPLGSCSPVRPLRALLCLCGVLGHLAPVHRCARVVCRVACAVSWVTRLLFTGAPARCVVLCVGCPGPLGSCSPVCPLGVLLCVCGVLGNLVPVHQLARPWCPVALLSSVLVRVRCPRPRGACSLVCALCALRVCRSWLCPSSSTPKICFLVPSRFFFLRKKKFKKLKKKWRAYTAGTGMGNWCGGAKVLYSLACVVGALVPTAPQGCGSRVLMYTVMGQGGFG